MAPLPVALLVVVALSAAACGDHDPTSSGRGEARSSVAPLNDIDGTTPLPDPLPAVAAQVNGQPIPTAFVSVLADEQLKTGDGTKSRTYAYRKALQQLIDRELLVEEALARGLSADDDRVQQVYNESRLHYKDEDDWATYLANEGLTRDALRAQIRAQLTAQALIDRESSTVPSAVSDAEARAFYDTHPTLFESGEKVRVAHIMLLVPQGATPGRKASRRVEAEGILRRLRGGGDFAKLAKELSEDKATADKGGELPPFGHGQRDPAFESAAFALKTGEISGVVETRFGFHILKLLERKASEHKPYDAIEARIKEYVLLSRRQQHMTNVLAGLRARAKIETYL
jgi:peptidyl-prolyl cis-trans isomerase C